MPARSVVNVGEFRGSQRSRAPLARITMSEVGAGMRLTFRGVYVRRTAMEVAIYFNAV